MYFRNVFLPSLLLVGSTWAQLPTSAFVQPGVPSGVPTPGNYRGALRPQVHFSPPKGFMVRFAYTVAYLFAFQSIVNDKWF